MLSCSFRCDQFHNSRSYEFSHTFSWYLSLTWMFNKLASDAYMFNIDVGLKQANNVTLGLLNLVTLSSVT